MAQDVSRADGGGSVAKLKGLGGRGGGDEEIGKKEDKAWRAMYAVQDCLTELADKKYRNTRERILAPTWAVVDGIQLLMLVVGRSSGFDPEVTRTFLRYIDLHVLFTGHEWEPWSRTYWAYTVLLVAATLMFFYRLLRIAKGHDGRGPQIYCSVLFRLFLYGLFIPFFKLHAGVFACGRDDWLDGSNAAPLLACMEFPWILYAGISGAMLAAGAAFFLPFFLFFRHNHLTCADKEARPHGRFHGVYAVARLAMVAATAAAAEPNMIASLVHLGGTAASLLALLYFLPNYHAPMNYIRAGFLAAATWLAAMSCLLLGLGRSTVLATAVSLALSGLLAAGGVGAVWFRYFQVARLAAAEGEVDYRNPYEVELAVRHLLLKHRDNVTPEIKANADAVYKAGISQYPTSAYLSIVYGHFMKAYAENEPGAVLEIKAAWRKEPALDFRFELASTRRAWERIAQIRGQADATRDVFTSQETKKAYSVARYSHSRTLKMMRAFWKTLAKKNLTVAGALSDVPARLAEIEKMAKLADERYAVLLKRFPSSKILLRSYGAFLGQCLNDKAKSQLYFMKADEVEESESRATASQSASQSQSQSAGGGTGAAMSASESASASSGASSSAAAAKRRALTRELQLRANEVKAVKQLFWGVVLGILVLAALSCAMFIVVKLLFVEYQQALKRLRTDSYQRRRVVAVNAFVRTMQLAAYNNDTAAFTAAAANIKDRAANYALDHRNLYFGFKDGSGIPPSVWDKMIHFQQDPTIPVKRFFPSADGARTYTDTMNFSFWDVGNMWSLVCKRISITPLEAFREVRSNRDVRLLFTNVMGPIHDALTTSGVLYKEEVLNIIDKSKWIILAVAAVSILALVCLELFVFRPSFKKVRATMRGVSDILSNIPRHLLKQIAKHYGKMHEKENEGSDDEAKGKGSEHGTDESDAEKEGEGDKGSGEGSGDESGGEKRKGHLKGRRRGRTGDQVRDVSEAPSEDESEAAERRRRGRRARSKRRDSDSSSDDDKARRKRKARAAAKAKASGAKAGAGGSGGDGESGEEEAGRPKPRVTSEMALDLALEDADTEAEAADRDREAAAIASAAELAIERASTGDIDRETGSGGGDVSAALGVPVEVLPVNSLERIAALSPSFSDGRPSPPHSLRIGGSSDREEAEDGIEKILSLSLEAKPASKPALGKGPRSFEAPAESLKLRGGRRRSSQLSSEAALDGPAGKYEQKGILRRQSKADLADAEEEKGASGKESRREKRGGRKEKMEKVSKKDGAEDGKDEADKKRKKAKEGEKKKAQADAADAKKDTGPDVLTVLTYKYLTAFVILGAIIAVNFFVCFFILEKGKPFAAELDYSGRRRSVAREIYFYAKELYVNDGMYLARAPLYARMKNRLDRLRLHEQNLKFGNSLAEFQLPGTDKRNAKLDALMYDSPQCLLANKEKCTETRNEDMQLVSNGLDALVLGFVDLGYQILMDLAPDLHLTGKEDAAMYPQGAKKAVYTGVDNVKNLRIMTQVDAADLDEGLASAATLLNEEALATMGVVELLEALILVFNTCFLLLLYVYLFSPMLNRLREESGRTGQILRMLPKDVVLKCRHLHVYYVGIADDESDADSDRDD